MSHYSRSLFCSCRKQHGSWASRSKRDTFATRPTSFPTKYWPYAAGTKSKRKAPCHPGNRSVICTYAFDHKRLYDIRRTCSNTSRSESGFGHGGSKPRRSLSAISSPLLGRFVILRVNHSNSSPTVKRSLGLKKLSLNECSAGGEVGVKVSWRVYLSLVGAGRASLESAEGLP